ncbi:MAG: uroporphyrinogen decarboxylase family protein [Planctomycetota bacterium]|jgi:uroporphyrinogen decarboxylase
MNSRERVICTLAHREPDRIPVHDAFWVDTLARWRKEGLPEDVEPEDYFDFDMRVMGIDASPRFKPELIRDDGEMVTLRDRFGYVVRKSKFKSRTMDFISHPVSSRKDWKQVKERFVLNAGEPARIDTEAFPFRLDTGPAWDVARQRYEALRIREKYIIASAYGPCEAIMRLRGFEAILYELHDDPELIHDMAVTYTTFLLQVIARCLARNIVFDGFCMIEDLAGTNGMLFSPGMWRELFKPLVRRIGAFLRQNNLAFWMHSCGNGEPVYEDLIQCGVEVINPLEAKSGLDVRELKKSYGDRLTFFGNIDVRAMAGSPEDIENEIRAKLTAAGQNGGYIYHSDHSVPPEVSFEQYQLAMKFVREYGASESCKW